ncbi:MAG TPA: hypothetical protein VIU11_13680 [Nakamurella sp.]
MSGETRAPGRLAGRVSWTVVDQGLSAASNFLLSVMVARAVDAEEFGAFAVAFLVYSITLAANRAMVGQPLQITFAAEGPRQFRSAVRSALGATLLVGLVTGGLLALAGWAVSGPTGHALIALAVTLPGLLVQDICRMAFFAAGTPARAAAIDALWTLVMMVGLTLGSGSAAGVWLPLLIWGGSGLLSGMLGLFLLGTLPRLRGAIRWALAQRRLTGYLLLEYALSQGLAQVGILMVGVLGTAAGVGALRAGQVLVGPLNILGTAAFMFAVPEVARRSTLSPAARQRFALSVSAVLGGIAVCYSALLLLLPDGWGEQLLGASWTGAQSVLLPTCVLAVSAAVAAGPVTMLYGMGLARVTLGVNLIRAPMLLVALLVAIPLWDAVGAAWALAAVETALLPIWFLRLRRELARTAGPPVGDRENEQRAVMTAASGED